MSNDRSEHHHLTPGTIASKKKWAELHQKEYQRAWSAKNKAKVRDSQKAYEKKNKAKSCAKSARWRKAHPEAVRAFYMSYKKRKNELEIARRKTAVGRFCLDCGRSDGEVYWSWKKGQCSACLIRERRNGRCRCGAIKSRHIGRGRRPPVCFECKDRPKHDTSTSRVLTAWDMLWTMTEDKSHFTWHDVARVTGAKDDSAKRHLDRIKRWLVQFDIDAHYEVIETENGGAQPTLCFDPRKLREVLRPLVDVLAGVKESA